MNKQQITAFVAKAIVGGALMGASLAHAQFVVNGSLEGPVVNWGVPTGWTILAGSPDTMNASNNVGVSGLQSFVAVPEASPDGGNWVGIGADTGFVESFAQTVSGLTVGVEYTLSWYAGNFGYAPLSYSNPNAIRATLNGVLLGTGASLPTSSEWVYESLNFVATSSSQVLAFQLDTSAKAYVSIDGIAITTAVVPEPASMALLLAGLAGVGLSASRAAKRRHHAA